jgi:hypothetical protein
VGDALLDIVCCGSQALPGGCGHGAVREWEMG